MKRRASKSYAVGVGALALVVALLALVVTGCGSGSAVDTNEPDTTVTSVDDSATDDTGTDDTATTSTVTGDTTSADDAAAEAAAATLPLTEADNGKSFKVKVGDTISVVLAGNPTTGYSWESAMAEEASPLLTLGGGAATYAPDNAGTNVVGSGGKFTFVFTAAAAGTVELKLKYWRPFEAQAEPLQTFGVTITIQ